MGQTVQVHARSAVVDLYGDHLRSHGWWAPVSAIVRLTGAVGVQAPATRTAISRLVAQGWLRPERRGGGRGYAATPDAQERWRRAHDRIYAAGPAPWDGTWHVVHVDSGGERRRRDQVRTTLSYLGYGQLGGGTWISPWPSPELASSLGRLQVRWLAVHGPLELATAGQHAAAADAGAPELVASVWDLKSLGRAYETFTELALRSVVEEQRGISSAYATRTRLVHEWRRFLFVDPDLPAAVLPTDWPGHQARQAFLRIAGELAPAAAGFVAGVLAGDPPDGRLRS